MGGELLGRGALEQRSNPLVHHLATVGYATAFYQIIVEIKV